MTDTIGIDLGTSSIKAGRFDSAGRLIACASRSYHEPDQHEVPFDRIFGALTDALREVLAATIDRNAPVAIGMSSQTNSFALLDAKGEVLTPVYLWTGDFAADQARMLEDDLSGESIARAIGMTRLTGQLLAPKCLYLRDAEPATWRRARGICLLPDLVIQRLCGRAATDPSLWSLTGLYDIRSGGWYVPMCDLLGVTPEMLPALSAAGSVAGGLAPALAEALGLPDGIPVAVGALDHLAGAIAVGNTRAGLASVSTGTAACVVVTHDRLPAAMEGGVVGPHPGDPRLAYALTWSGLSSTGLNWYARQARTSASLSDLLVQAACVPTGADGYVARPLDPSSGDAGFEFAHGHPGSPPPTPGQAVRAILECLSEELRRLLTLAAGDQRIERVVAIGGGVQSDLWMQILADTIGLPVIVPDCIEASAAGAARFAALAAGRIESLAGDVPAVTAARAFHPARRDADGDRE